MCNKTKEYLGVVPAKMGESALRARNPMFRAIMAKSRIKSNVDRAQVIGIIWNVKKACISAGRAGIFRELKTQPVEIVRKYFLSKNPVFGIRTAKMVHQ